MERGITEMSYYEKLKPNEFNDLINEAKKSYKTSSESEFVKAKGLLLRACQSEAKKGNNEFTFDKFNSYKIGRDLLSFLHESGYSKCKLHDSQREGMFIKVVLI